MIGVEKDKIVKLKMTADFRCWEKAWKLETWKHGKQMKKVDLDSFLKP